MVTVEKLSAILRKAEALVGEPLGEYGEDLTSIAVMLACGWCNREDIPEDMEGAVALMVSSLTGAGGGVKSVTRGDTAITYDTNAMGNTYQTLLAPWRRLATVKEDAP